jgi:hypothetical protein
MLVESRILWKLCYLKPALFETGYAMQVYSIVGLSQRAIDDHMYTSGLSTSSEIHMDDSCCNLTSSEPVSKADLPLTLVLSYDPATLRFKVSQLSTRELF